MSIFIEKPVKLRQCVLKPFAIGVALFILGFASNWLCRNLLGGRFMFLDAVVFAVAAGCIALWYERLRMREFLGKLVVVREMNHHVRNALQVVIIAASAHHDEDLARMVFDAVARIDWALKEVLSGNGTDQCFRAENHRVTEDRNTVTETSDGAAESLAQSTAAAQGLDELKERNGFMTTYHPSNIRGQRLRW
jgi:hypothetical protein